MRLTFRQVGPAFLTLTLAAPLLIGGCAARVRYYDEDHHDYHRWNRDEDVHYRVYVRDQHMEGRNFRDLNKDQQRDYWKWRHDHPDAH